MKKLLALLVSLIMAFSLVGCSSEKPDKIVTEFFTAMQSFDFNAMKGCLFSAEGAEEILIEGDIESSLYDAWGKWAKEMKFSVEAITENGDDATVTVKLDYVDASIVMVETLTEYIGQAFALAFTGASDEAVSALMESILKDKIETVETTTAQKKLDISCIKVDKGWKIKELPDEIVDVISANMISVFENFENSEEPEVEEVSAEDMIYEINNWYVGDVWNYLVDFQCYISTGKDCTGADIDIDFAYSQFKKSYDKKDEYNTYINNLGAEYQDVKDVWSKMVVQMDEIYNQLETNGVVQNGININLDLLGQYGDAFWDIAYGY